MPNVMLKVTANIVFGYATWVFQCLSFSSRNSMLKYILFSIWHVMLLYIIFVKLPRCWGFWVEFKWIHQWSLYQIPEGAPPRGWEDNCSARQCGWRWGKGTMSMLKLNEALQLLLVKCWSIKLKQMINLFEMSTISVLSYFALWLLLLLNIIISKINFGKKYNWNMSVKTCIFHLPVLGVCLHYQTTVLIICRHGPVWPHKG